MSTINQKTPSQIALETGCSAHAGPATCHQPSPLGLGLSSSKLPRPKVLPKSGSLKRKIDSVTVPGWKATKRWIMESIDGSTYLIEEYPLGETMGLEWVQALSPPAPTSLYPVEGYDPEGRRRDMLFKKFFEEMGTLISNDRSGRWDLDHSVITVTVELVEFGDMRLQEALLMSLLQHAQNAYDGLEVDKETTHNPQLHSVFSKLSLRPHQLDGDDWTPFFDTNDDRNAIVVKVFRLLFHSLVQLYSLQEATTGNWGRIQYFVGESTDKQWISEALFDVANAWDNLALREEQYQKRGSLLGQNFIVKPKIHYSECVSDIEPSSCCPGNCGMSELDIDPVDSDNAFTFELTDERWRGYKFPAIGSEQQPTETADFTNTTLFSPSPMDVYDTSYVISEQTTMPRPIRTQSSEILMSEQQTPSPNDPHQTSAGRCREERLVARAETERIFQHAQTSILTADKAEKSFIDRKAPQMSKSKKYTTNLKIDEAGEVVIPMKGICSIIFKCFKKLGFRK